MKKEILAVIRGIEKFLIFLAPKPFLIRTDCKGILDIVKKNLSNMQAQGRLMGLGVTNDLFVSMGMH